MEFKDRLRELRISRNLSQMQLAKELHLSQSAVAKWELGKTEPSSSAIISLAKFFDETTDYILGLTD
ncbi:MAG: helix-turn-helix transcriptional regulator [Firmicutes bacterium]|uniref:Helix-turn-helix transcriptional regulator n=1 Tax=Candidatus Stercoripulliclostridium pullicola TaxID=2840953 RepID=A0A940DGM4_9FIRM|nr:helix-turn-helix transcriptional regulator [Candidatus Stercoripulliclostridium pullicola]